MEVTSPSSSNRNERRPEVNHESNNENRTSKTEKLRTSCAEFIEHQWKFTTNDFKILKEVEPAVLKRLHDSSRLGIFNKLFTNDLWSILVNSVNRELVKGKGTNYKVPIKGTSVPEMKKFYGIRLFLITMLGTQIRLETTFGNLTRNLRTHFKQLKEMFGPVKKLGMRRFEQLRSAFNPTIEELKEISSIFKHNIQSLLDDVSLVVVDETVIGYQPRATTKQKAEAKGEPIPVVFIQRKPHPNGLEIFLGVTFLQSLLFPDRRFPLIIDIFPHLQVGDVTPLKAVSELMKGWFSPNKPHIVTDSAFGYPENIRQVQEWGGTITTSVPAGSLSYVWDVLSWNVSPLHFRTAINQKVGCLFTYWV